MRFLVGAGNIGSETQDGLGRNAQLEEYGTIELDVRRHDFELLGGTGPDGGNEDLPRHSLFVEVGGRKGSGLQASAEHGDGVRCHNRIRDDPGSRSSPQDLNASEPSGRHGQQ
jgi:hypothetical protein